MQKSIQVRLITRKNLNIIQITQVVMKVRATIHGGLLTIFILARIPTIAVFLSGITMDTVHTDTTRTGELITLIPMFTTHRFMIAVAGGLVGIITIGTIVTTTITEIITTDMIAMRTTTMVETRVVAIATGEIVITIVMLA